MAKLFWYKRNPQQWLNATRELTLEERGAYNDLLELLYLRDRRIPDEPKFCARFLGISPRKWAAIRDVLLDHDCLVERGGYLTNPRFERERQASAQERDKHSERSRRGGKARAEQAARDRQGRFDGFDEENGSFPPASSSRHLDETPAKPQNPTSQEKTQQNQSPKPAARLDDLDDSFLHKNEFSRDFRATFDEFSEDFRPDSEGENRLESMGVIQPRARAGGRARVRDRLEDVESSSSKRGSGGETASRLKSKKAAQLRADWSPAPLNGETADIVANWPDRMLERELAKFKDHAAAQGRTAKDWDAAFRNWLRKADDDFARTQHRDRTHDRQGWASVGNRIAGASGR
jgi:uncharacterized protein YdaU (DUF1376 family)